MIFLFIPILLISMSIWHKADSLILDCSYKVLEIVDGDTIRVQKCISDKCIEYKIRYLGIDTPELHRQGYDVQFRANEARDFNVSMITDVVCLDFEPYNRYDIYDRLLAYVYNLSGSLINESLLREGYARYADYNSPLKYKDRFLSAQNNAISHRLGIWDRALFDKYLLDKEKIDVSKFHNYKNKYISTIFFFKSFNVSSKGIKIYTDYKNKGNYISMSNDVWDLYFKPLYKDYNNLLQKSVYVEGLLRFNKKQKIYYIPVDAPWQLED